MIRFRPFLVASLALVCALPLATSAADPERGRSLYETRCDSCHAQSVHGRAKREASGFESLRGWVRRWSGNMGLKWTDEEVDDVTVYLNGRFYRFACPPSACKTTGGTESASRFARAGSTAPGQ